MHCLSLARTSITSEKGSLTKARMSLCSSAPMNFLSLKILRSQDS